MRSYEFAMKCKAQLYLGERSSPLLFKRVDGHFTPAVLCLEAEALEAEALEEELPGTAASWETLWRVKAIPGLLYWEPGQGAVVRERIPYATQKELGIPFCISIPYREETEEQGRERQKRYYVTAEKVCCALEAGCLTPEMAAQYGEYVQPRPSEELLRVYRRFFPEASEKIYGR